MPDRPAFARWLGSSNDVTSVFLNAGSIPDLINLGGGLPEPSIWPVAELSEIAARAVADHPAQALGYAPVAGLPALRSIIAERFSQGDLRLKPENVLITTGGMQALDLIGRVLMDEGGLIAAQTPAYLGALDAWRPRLPHYRRMRLEAPGFDPKAELAGAQFAYTVPNFSNPSGRLVSADERRALVAAAEATGVWLVEDDPYGALYYDGPAQPRMLTLAASGDRYDGPVIYCGTLSKEVAPGLRIGWVIAAEPVIRAMTTAKQGADMCVSGLCQRIACEAFTSGLVDRILPKILSVYRERRDALATAMGAHLAPNFIWEKPVGGMFIWARARDSRLDTDRLMKIGLDHGVCVSPSSVFDPEGEDRGAIRMNFTLNPPEKLAEGVARLFRATKAALAEASAPAA